MKNVISFPEKKMKQALNSQKLGAKQAALSLSLVSILMGAVLLNDAMTRTSGRTYLISDNMNSSDIQNLNRAIASAQPLNPFRDREWEKKLAQRLGGNSLEERTPASIGKSVSTLDQLRFGSLAGKYQLVAKAGEDSAKVQEISYVDSLEASDRPVYLEPDQFLKQYGNLLAVEFSNYDRANPFQEQIREYRLLNSQQMVVGTAAFVMDDDGRFLSLKVRSAEQNQP